MIGKQGVSLLIGHNGVQDKTTLNPVNETVNKGIYDATLLSTVDPDLAPANIKLAVDIFGKVGTIALAVTEAHFDYTTISALTDTWVTKVTVGIPSTASKVIIVVVSGYTPGGKQAYTRALYNGVERIAQFSTGAKRWHGDGVGSAADVELQCKWIDSGNDELRLGRAIYYY